MFEQQQALPELYQKLEEAEAQSLSGVEGISHRDFMKQLRGGLIEQTRQSGGCGQTGQ